MHGAAEPRDPAERVAIRSHALLDALFHGEKAVEALRGLTLPPPGGRVRGYAGALLRQLGQHQMIGE